MSPAQIITSIVMVAGGTVYMAFKAKCFSPLCLLSYFSLTAGMLAFYTFVESLLGAVLPNKEAKEGGLGIAPRRGQPSAEESPPVEFEISNYQQENNWLGRINSSLLKNPWFVQFLEKNYYGLGQAREYEPPAMLRRMEKFAAGGTVATVGLTLIMGWRFNPGLMAVGFVAGFMIPHLQAKKKIGERQRRALMNLPSFVDLLALTIESGLDYLNSMDKILMTTYKNRGTLEEEVENVLRQVQLGYPRRDSLRNMARRLDVQEIRSLSGLLIQSDELGTGLVQLLRNFSQDMRNRRTGRAEELAGKASTKMLGPMMIFIFPVIFVLILAPFGVSLIKGGGVSF